MHPPPRSRASGTSGRPRRISSRRWPPAAGSAACAGKKKAASSSRRHLARAGRTVSTGLAGKGDADIADGLLTGDRRSAF